MKALRNLCLYACLGIAALALSACGGGGGGTASTSTPVILVHDGGWGYYSNGNWCNSANNYCNTGLNYGITSGGLYYNGVYFSSGTTSSGSTGATTSPGTGGTTSPGTGAVTSPGNGPASPGLPGILDPIPPGPVHAIGDTTTSPGTTNGTGGVENTTTDVNLMRAIASSDQVNAQAHSLVNRFPMSFEAARQLVQLSDKMTILRQNNQLRDIDRSAIAMTALAVGHVTPTEVNDALVKFANGDKTALTNVELKYAHNVGLSSDDMPIVRDQILPTLGVQVPR